MRLVKDVDGRNGSPFGLAHAATIAVAAVLTAVVMALLLPSSVFAAPETPPTAVGSIPDQEVVQGGVITVDVEEFFNDPDGPDDTLVYTAASSVDWDCGHGWGNRQRRDDHCLGGRGRERYDDDHCDGNRHRHQRRHPGV